MTKFPGGDPVEVHPADSRAESQSGLNGPSGSPTSPSGALSSSARSSGSLRGPAEDKAPAAAGLQSRSAAGPSSDPPSAALTDAAVAETHRQIAFVDAEMSVLRRALAGCPEPYLTIALGNYNRVVLALYVATAKEARGV